MRSRRKKLNLLGRRQEVRWRPVIQHHRYLFEEKRESANLSLPKQKVARLQKGPKESENERGGGRSEVRQEGGPSASRRDSRKKKRGEQK